MMTSAHATTASTLPHSDDPVRMDQVGASLIESGYWITPIRPREKSPALKGWTNRQLAATDIEHYENFGVGILTGCGPSPLVGVDIDCLDREVADEMTTWIVETVGPAPVRIGRAPKILLVFKTADTWLKRTSPRFVSPDGNHQQIELLGFGQQFVAYGVHPNTGEPYRWPGRSLLDTRPHELVEFPASKVDALFARFAQRMTDRGYRIAEKVNRTPRTPLPLDLPGAIPAHLAACTSDNRELIHRRPPPAETPENIARLKRALAVQSADCDYEQWRNVVFSIHAHDWRCGEDIAREWSMSAPDRYDEDAFARLWGSARLPGGAL